MRFVAAKVVAKNRRAAVYKNFLFRGEKCAKEKRRVRNFQTRLFFFFLAMNYSLMRSNPVNVIKYTNGVPGGRRFGSLKVSSNVQSRVGGL